MKATTRKAACATLSAVLALTAMPLSSSVSAETTGTKVIIDTDFEDGDVSLFSNRGGDDTTEISCTEESAVSGTHALLASGRSESWNGPAFRLDELCEPYTEYYLSASVKGKWYTSATLSFQYTDGDGVVHYANLVQNLSGSDWQTVKNQKISFTDDMTDVYVYFEGGSDDLYIDDFKIVEVPAMPIETDIPSLKNVYANYFKIGTALTPSDMSSKSFMDLVNKHFSASITVGNELKPDSVLAKDATLAYVEETGDDTNPQVSFAAAKPVLNYCQKNNIPVRVHTLVWHSQTPVWFFKENFDESGDWVSEEKMLKRMENYIKNYFETLVKLYPDVDFYACDVVNEAWNDQGTPRSAYQDGNYETSSWVKVFGDNSFIKYAFTYARKYAPKGCKLFYNDYNEYMTGKMEAVLKMVNELKADNLIDGIGMQSHLDVRSGSDAFPSISMYEAAVKAYTGTGLDVQVTELDATIQSFNDNTFKAQAKYYSDLFDVLVKYSDKISAVIFWGVTDTNSWRASQKPLLFDDEYKAKPAFDSIIDGIEYTEPKVTTTTTPAPVITTTTTVGTVTATLLGDANCDGKVSIADAVLVSRFANEDKVSITTEGRANADVDKDGAYTLDDATAIIKIIARLA